MQKIMFALSSLFILQIPIAELHAAPCAFDTTKNCVLQRNILTDVGTNGLNYYGATNYDHRLSGEINVYKATLTQPYVDSTNVPGQIKFLANKVNSNLWNSGEMMTRANLQSAPFNAPKPSNPWTTKEITHGYLEVVVRMPKCDTSSDGLCQAGNAPNSYSAGLWPAIWMMPTFDARWPDNGEIDISEAYLRGTDYRTSTAALHFNGNDPRCSNNDCVFNGFPLTSAVASSVLWNAFHTWGFEWQPDPASANGGRIITGYFDNVRVWGPLRTDTLPADGPNALRRGFNDPNGGYYLIVNLAIGGPYAGAPNGQMQSSSMYLQSAKTYVVDGGPPPADNKCYPATNIQSMYSQNKSQITIAWMPPAQGLAVLYYQIADWQKRVMWKGTKPTDRVFQDQTLPGTSGKFTYFVSTICVNNTSAAVQYDAIVTLHPVSQLVKVKK